MKYDIAKWINLLLVKVLLVLLALLVKLKVDDLLGKIAEWVDNFDPGHVWVHVKVLLLAVQQLWCCNLSWVNFTIVWWLDELPDELTQSVLEVLSETHGNILFYLILPKQYQSLLSYCIFVPDNFQNSLGFYLIVHKQYKSWLFYILCHCIMRWDDHLLPSLPFFPR